MSAPQNPQPWPPSPCDFAKDQSRARSFEPKWVAFSSPLAERMIVRYPELKVGPLPAYGEHA
jgi:hypothetical protein